MASFFKPMVLPPYCVLVLKTMFSLDINVNATQIQIFGHIPFVKLSLRMNKAVVLGPRALADELFVTAPVQADVHYEQRNWSR